MKRPIQERPMSANSLRLYQRCPLRFRFRYIDGLYLNLPPTEPNEEQRAMQLGEQFHLMARRYYAGLEPGSTGEAEAERLLSRWMQALEQFLPHTAAGSYFPELELRLNRPDLRLVATLDLLLVHPNGEATIYDWKTHQRMPGRATFAASLQTRLYRYTLCAAGGSYSPTGRFNPDQVSMLYWNPQYPDRPERLPYSEAQFLQDEEYLRGLIRQIYQSPADSFLATSDPSVCFRCEYRPICHGRPAAGEAEWLAAPFDEEELEEPRNEDLPRPDELPWTDL